MSELEFEYEPTFDEWLFDLSARCDQEDRRNDTSGLAAIFDAIGQVQGEPWRYGRAFKNAFSRNGFIAGVTHGCVKGIGYTMNQDWLCWSRGESPFGCDP